MRSWLLLVLLGALCVVDGGGGSPPPRCNKMKSFDYLNSFMSSATCKLPVPAALICSNLTAESLLSNASFKVQADVDQCIGAIDEAENKSIKTQKSSERINCYFNVCINAIQNLGNETAYAAGVNCAIAFAIAIDTSKGGANSALLFRMFYQRCTANHQSNVTCIATIVNQCFFYGQEQYFLFRCLRILSRICTSVSETEGRSECVAAVRAEVRSELVTRCSQSQNGKICMSAVNNSISSNRSGVMLQDITLTASMIRGLARNSMMREVSLHLLADTFSKLGNEVENLVDESDADELMGLFDDIVDYGSVMYHAMNVDFGSMVLSCLERMVKAFGRALLLPNGKLESTFNFRRPNTRLNLYLSNSSETYYQSPTTSEDLTEDAAIRIPSTQLCRKTKNRMLKNITHGCNQYAVDEACKTVVGTVALNNLGLYLTRPSSNYTVISNVLSSQIVPERGADTSKPRNGTFLIKFDFPTSLNALQLYPNSTIVCKFWNFSISDWSDEGVEVHNMTNTTVWCNSTHLTSFAVLLDHQNLFNATNPVERLALNVISYIGSSLSFVSLVITVIFLAAFRKKLNRGPLLFVHLNFAVSLALALLLLLVGLGTASGVKWLCAVVAGLLHYLFLCVFCWMLAEAIMLYLMIVKVFVRVFGRADDKWYYLLPLGWGLPILVVAITAAVRPDGYGVNTHCWLSTENGVVWAFVGPVIAIVCFNSVLLVVAIFQILKMKARGGAKYDVKKTDLAITAIKGAVVLLPLLGITWIVGVFAVDANTTIFIWIFTIINSCQGVAILIIHVLRTQIVIAWFRSSIVQPVSSYFSRSSTIEGLSGKRG